jgi:gamma-glutamylcyclotransferase (GGCT)/AIG2-like uncharacterized protein YtfP
MRQLVFCYGTLMTARLLATVIGRRAARCPARVMDYARAALPGRPYPGLWQCAGTSTAGQLVSLRHRRELRRLDHYEGDEYRRHRLRVSSPRGVVHAWVYLPHSARPAAARPWSRRQFERRHLRRYLRHIAARQATGVAEADAGTA